MDAVGLDRLARRFGDRRIGVHREIVLRGEVDALHGIAVVVARGDAAVRTVVGRAAERPEAVLAAEVLPGVEAFDAGEEVAPAGIAEVAHAAFERVRARQALSLSSICILDAWCLVALPVLRPPEWRAGNR